MYHIPAKNTVCDVRLLHGAVVDICQMVWKGINRMFLGYTGHLLKERKDNMEGISKWES